MANNFLQLNEKISNLRRYIKDLHNTMFNLYNIEKNVGNNKAIFARKNLDNLSKAFVHIAKINLKKANFRNSSDKEEAKQLYSNISQGIDKLSKLLTIRISEEMVGNINKDTNFKENLDNIRLAQGYIKALDSETYLDNKEISEIEKALRNY